MSRPKNIELWWNVPSVHEKSVIICASSGPPVATLCISLPSGSNSEWHSQNNLLLFKLLSPGDDTPHEDEVLFWEHPVKYCDYKPHYDLHLSLIINLVRNFSLNHCFLSSLAHMDVVCWQTVEVREFTFVYCCLIEQKSCIADQLDQWQ